MVLPKIFGQDKTLSYKLLSEIEPAQNSLIKLIALDGANSKQSFVCGIFLIPSVETALRGQ